MSSPDILDLKRLRIFYEVAKAGSVSAACDVLELTQPSISRQIQDLEEELNTKLFFRHSRGVELTSQGKILFRFAERTFKEAEIVRKLMAEDLTALKGELRIATTPALGSTWLMHYLSEFLQLHPQIRVTIVGHLTAADLNHADVLIRTFIPDQPDLIQRYLKTFKMRLYASKAYLEKFGTPKTPDDLDHHHLVVFGDQGVDGLKELAWPLQWGTKPNTARVPYMRVNSAEGLVNAAQANLGIIEVAEDYIALRHKDLVPVLSDWQGLQVDIYYTYPAQLHGSKKITGLCDFLESSLAETR